MPARESEATVEKRHIGDDPERVAMASRPGPGDSPSRGAKGAYQIKLADFSTLETQRVIANVENRETAQELVDDLARAKAKHEERPAMARRVDEREKAPRTTDYETWASDPRRYDFPGVDTPRTQGKAPSRAESFDPTNPTLIGGAGPGEFDWRELEAEMAGALEPQVIQNEMRGGERTDPNIADRRLLLGALESDLEGDAFSDYTGMSRKEARRSVAEWDVDYREMAGGEEILGPATDRRLAVGALEDDMSDAEFVNYTGMTRPEARRFVSGELDRDDVL